MSKFNYENLVLNLPDELDKDRDSNNYKLLLIEKYIYDRILQIYKDVESVLNIDNCYGVTLDNWGKRMQVAQGTLDDVQYRLMIKSKIGQSFCDGSRDSVASTLAFMLSCSPDLIKIKSGDKERSIIIEDLPFSVLEEANIEDEQIIEIINDMLPSGVTVERIGISGTFELGETWGEQDEEKGLSDLDRTTGGYLGTVRR